MTDIRDDFEAALEATDAWDFSEVDDGLVDDILAALAARGLTVVREGELDVERLAEAVQTTILTSPGEYTGPGMGAYRTRWADLTPRQKRHVLQDAVALAAEYARLTRQPEGQ